MVKEVSLMTIIVAIMGLSIFFIMSNAIVNPMINQTFSKVSDTFTGTTGSALTGLFTLIFILSTIAIAIMFFTVRSWRME